MNSALKPVTDTWRQTSRCGRFEAEFNDRLCVGVGETRDGTRSSSAFSNRTNVEFPLPLELWWTVEPLPTETKVERQREFNALRGFRFPSSPCLRELRGRHPGGHGREECRMGSGKRLSPEHKSTSEAAALVRYGMAVVSILRWQVSTSCRRLLDPRNLDLVN